MIQPMTPETIQRLMDQASPGAAEQESACEMYTRAVIMARSLVAAYGPDGAERFARQLSRHLARQLELARADDVSGSHLSTHTPA